jgi:pimeloyl-ACP methyl ester carboxylesterase
MRMICMLFAAFVLLASQGNAQKSFTPYPIIFIHGLDNSDKVWYPALTDISKVYGDHLPTTGDDIGTVLHASLNRYRDMTSIFGPDGIPGNTDDDVYVNPTAPLPSGIYTVNFETSWNEVPSKPILYPYKDLWIIARESQSNQSAIVKSGYALQQCIKQVLAATGAEKVVLFGFSMGGIAIREYLQRRVDGSPRWWVDPQAADGHRVAKVVTLCSPHLGTDVIKWVPGVSKEEGSTQADIVVPNSSAEAVRDLRITYASGSQSTGIYMFGGYEGGLNTNWLISGWHNGDVDCNGRDTDTVIGINQGVTSSLPLPLNLPYTYITSKFGFLSSDLVVEVARQVVLSDSGELLPRGVSDTLNIFYDHWTALSDAGAMMRGLDEPGTQSLAYGIALGRHYRGALTIQSGGGTSDTDIYRLPLGKLDNLVSGLHMRLYDTVASKRDLTVIVRAANSNVLLERTVQASTPVDVFVDSAMFAAAGSELYISISGEATTTSWKHPYEFMIEPMRRTVANPIIRGLADTVVTSSDTLMDVFSVIYDYPDELQYVVTSSDTTVIPLSNISILGSAPNLVLQVIPQENVFGWSAIRVLCADSNATAETEFRIRVIEDDVTGINDESLGPVNDVTISPLPVNQDRLTITVTDDDNEIVDLTVVDVTGAVVPVGARAFSPMPSRIVTVDVASVPSAQYFLRVTTRKGVVVRALPIVR